MKTSTKRTIWIVLAVAAVCCLAVITAALILFLVNRPASAAAAPLVYFENPSNGQTLTAGEEITVHIVARDRSNVTRVELWVNGELVSNKHSPLEGGITPFPLVVEWIPPAAGEYSLLARAYNSANASATAEIHVTSSETTVPVGPDGDADGFPDEVDLCPAEPGVDPDGCPPVIPDVDGDGVEDTLDACPDVAGMPVAEGCPDRDADGIPDDADACPDEIGAADSPAGEGCPSASADDGDSDGVIDSDDACPGEPGAAETEGCPVGDETGGVDEELSSDSGEEAVVDTDSDGLPDEEDTCPAEAGEAESGGCPDDAPDTDGDGFPDSVDLCPEEAGEAPDGCPAAAPGDTDDDDGGFPFGDMGFMLPARTFVEFQALTFNVAQDYDEVFCYATITPDPPEFYGPFNFNGERSWDITEYIGSIPLMNPASPIPVHLTCSALSGLPGHPRYHYLGEYDAEHPEAEWDGRILNAWVGSEGEAEGFNATYRICSPSCAAVDLPAPVLAIIDTPFMGQVLQWNWAGNEDQIDHFNIYINGAYRRNLPSGYRGIQISSFEPVCGEELTFQVSAAAGEHESPLSNSVTWAGPECERRVRITFESVITHDIRDGLSSRVGPIRGSFWANDQLLQFDADHYPYYGFALPRDGTTRVIDIFGTILDYNNNHTLCGGTACHGFYAPEVNYVEMDLPEGDALTVGVRIMDADAFEDDELIDTSETIPYDQIVPSRRVLHDNDFEVVYWIDVVAGPGSEPGDGAYPPPDLMISELVHFGPGRETGIWVENIGEGPLFPQPIHVQYVDRVTGDVFFEVTYPEVEIPYGERTLLSTGRDDIPITNIQVLINPEQSVPESDYSNNVFYAPVLLHVSLEEIRDVSRCDPRYQSQTEHKYRYRVGYGPRPDDIVWTSTQDYPEWGYYVHESGSGRDSLFPAGDESRFNVEIMVPHENYLFVQVEGWEVDFGEDDHQGMVFASYSEEIYFGADNMIDRRNSAGTGANSCEDHNYPSGETYFGFTASLVINTVSEP